MKITTDNPILYVQGDATKPLGNDNRLIIHCCNDIGAWGAGFVLALNKRWMEPYHNYLQWSIRKNLGYANNFKLGNIQITPVDKNLAVANMIGQHDCKTDAKGNPPIRYKAIRKCLKKVCKYCLQNDVTVHAPKFGADLAGGNWDIIEKLIIKELCNKGVNVTVYNYVPSKEHGVFYNG